MAQMVSWPALADDDGSLTSGTVVNAAWEQAVKASIEDQTHNATYPTIKPKAITGEVEAIKAAKTAGSWDDLEDALDKVVDFADGSLIVPASVIDQATLQAALGGKNLVMNSTFLIWPKATQAAYFANQAQASRDATVKKIGQASLKITRSGSDIGSANVLIDDIASLMAGYFQGKTFGFGGWVKCGTSSTGVLRLSDGVTSTDLTHSGGGEWEWLSGTKTFSGAATVLTLTPIAKNNDVAVNFDGLTVTLSEQAPAQWIPNETVYGSLYFPFAGALSIGDLQGVFTFTRPAMVKDIQCGGGTPHDGTPVTPSGVVTIDIVKWDGSDWDASIFSAPKDIVDTLDDGSVQPDGTFINRCFTGGSGVIANLSNAKLALNLDAVNSAEGLWFAIRCLQYVNPLEGFLAYDDL